MSDLATQWQCGSYTLSLEKPLVMGIVNVTPDSFSDGGCYADASQAIAHAQQLIQEGAQIIDVGGESTRPGALPLEPSVELDRVLPVVSQLAQQGIVVSIDTRHHEVAQACVDAGASIINDVSGFSDQAMVQVALSCSAGLVIMHMQQDPQHMQDKPTYGDVVQEVSSYLVKQARMLESFGVASERVCIDPGIGFGKTTEHNLELIRATSQLAYLGWPLMVAVSRKRFIGELLDVEVPKKRVAGSVACACYACVHGARIARVHDVSATVEALKMLTAIA